MNHLRKTTDGTWEVRIVVPPEVRGVIGKNNLTKRLGRLTKSEANNRAAPVIAEFQARIAAARAGDVNAVSLPERASATSEQPTVRHVSLRALFEGYIDERKPASATVRRFRGVIERFIRDVGHDNAARITPQDVVDWKTTLLQSLSGKTVKEVYLSALKVVLRWGKDNLKIPTNPADGITVRVPKAEYLRSQGFTADEARKILHAALTNWYDELPPHYRRARRWVPWICAYSGARVGEVTQMRGCDVFERDGCLVMRITPEAGSVKNGKMRLVPVHEDLRAQGFLLAVKSAGDGPLFYDPNEKRKHDDVKYKLWDKTAAHLRDFVSGLFENLEVAPNHAWRHTFRTIAREAEMDTPCVDYIVSHARKSQGDKYGDWTIKANAKQMAKFPRYILSDEAATE
ncbi:DUF6538 domain-containing protein [Erythrobacter sp. NE805]|uniref:DUF6538 domain-containing protein n=1 Tax=Erythrobacter sp. NE805 TaxID=3389875 RepID=UPI00396AFD13